ncbi:MAG: 26S protease regulatory subunit [Planctomycetes bacterium]|nr:26S protease regulatory subunit [Planctomycetota bacterium]
MRVDLQKTLRGVLSSAREHRYCGVRNEYAHEGISLGSMLASARMEPHVSSLEHEEIDVGEAEPVRCVKQALWLLESGGQRYAVLLADEVQYGMRSGIRVEVGHAPEAAGERLASELFKALEKGVAAAGTYRGKVLSLEVSTDYRGQTLGLKVHKMRPVERDGIILPQRTLALIDQNVLKFAEQRRALAELGLSAKKGLLFFGPPGTGKTLTLHYLIQALQGHTFLLVTAEQQGAIAEYMLLARLLQPAVVVIEDADLIARNREDMASACVESLLSTLLNEMDGLRPDAEIFFILTTNRPQALEPALVSRPGRIDQAIEFPMPDEPCRARLLRLYAGKIGLADGLVASVASRTEGVSAAFIKEFVRRAVQYALDAGRAKELAAPDIENALQDMLQQRGTLQGRLLGAGPKDAPAEQDN